MLFFKTGMNGTVHTGTMKIAAFSDIGPPRGAHRPGIVYRKRREREKSK